MPSCKVCLHPDRATIDKEIVTGVSLRDIARQYGMSRGSVDRHKKHIPKALTKARQAETVAESTSLLSRVERLMDQCEAAYAKAEKAGKWAGAAAFAREIRGSIELLGRLSGELQSGARVAVNFALALQSLDVSALTGEQVAAIYDRIQEESLREISQMTNEEIEARIFKLIGYSGGSTVDSAYLFDEETVPYPSVGDPTWHQRNFENMEACAVRNGWKPTEWRPDRGTCAADRFRLLEAAWKRITGRELKPTLDLPAAATATIQIEFDLAEGTDNSWHSWPKARLVANVPENSIPALPQVIEGR
jgi:hypothetical protein